jgi:hypothetical protein
MRLQFTKPRKKRAGQIELIQSINVTPVAMKLKKLMPAIH